MTKGSLTLRLSRRMGQSAFAEMKRKYEGKILHQSHPVSRTVQRVGMRIAEASGLRNVDWLDFASSTAQQD